MNASRLGALWLLIALPLDARSQVVVGDTVRVRAPGQVEVTGVYMRSDAVSLWLYPRGGRDSVLVVLGETSRTEVLRGRSREVLSSVGRGALIGMGLGFAATFLTARTTQSNREVGGRGGAIVITTVLGTGIGALAGALTGAVEQQERWERFDPANATGHRATVTVRVRGVSVGDTVRLRRDHARDVVGILTRVSDSALVVAEQGADSETVTATSALRQAFVLHGTRRLGTRVIGKSAMVGAGIGTGAGALNGSVLAAVLTGTVGATLGTVVGALASPFRVDDWIPFDPHTMTIAAGDPP